MWKCRCLNGIWLAKAFNAEGGRFTTIHIHCSQTLSLCTSRQSFFNCLHWNDAHELVCSTVQFPFSTMMVVSDVSCVTLEDRTKVHILTTYPYHNTSSSASRSRYICADAKIESEDIRCVEDLHVHSEQIVYSGRLVVDQVLIKKRITGRRCNNVTLKGHSSIRVRFLRDDKVLNVAAENRVDRKNVRQEDHTYVATRDERVRYRGHWCFTHNPCINTAATRQREDNFSNCIKISSRENRSRHQW